MVDESIKKEVNLEEEVFNVVGGVLPLYGKNYLCFP